MDGWMDGWMDGKGLYMEDGKMGIYEYGLDYL